MATDKEFLDFVLEQLGGVDGLSCRKMFGEYALYHGGKIVAMVCDNRLLVKPTAGGRSFIGTPVEAEPYPGAKPCFLIEEQLEEREWLCELVQITAKEIPVPAPRKAAGATAGAKTDSPAKPSTKSPAKKAGERSVGSLTSRATSRKKTG